MEEKGASKVEVHHGRLLITLTKQLPALPKLQDLPIQGVFFNERT